MPSEQSSRLAAKYLLLKKVPVFSRRGRRIRHAAAALAKTSQDPTARAPLGSRPRPLGPVAPPTPWTARQPIAARPSPVGPRPTPRTRPFRGGGRKELPLPTE